MATEAETILQIQHSRLGTLRSSAPYDEVPRKGYHCIPRYVDQNEFGICLAYVRGPWSSESNHQLIINGGKEIFKNFKSDMPLFKHHIYERYTRAKNKQRLPPAFGTREHREQM